MVRKGYSKLILLQGIKGNPSRLLLLETGYKTLHIVGEILLSGVTLSVDKPAYKGRKIVRELDAVNDEHSLIKMLKNFLRLPLYDPSRQGIPARIFIESEDDIYRIKFKSDSGDVLYPILKVRKWTSVNMN